jgi:hypothetical protein
MYLYIYSKVYVFIYTCIYIYIYMYNTNNPRTCARMRERLRVGKQQIGIVCHTECRPQQYQICPAMIAKPRP